MSNSSFLNSNNDTFCKRNPDIYACDGKAIDIVSLPLAAGGVGLILVCLFSFKENEQLKNISNRIRSASMTFLEEEYQIVGLFVFGSCLILAILCTLDPPSTDRVDGARYAISFLTGALLSALAGWAGMSAATYANVRTAEAADKKGLFAAINVAITSGSIIGFVVVGLGLLGLSIMFLLLSIGYNNVEDNSLIARLVYSADSLASFGFGASSIALFVRVCGGIFSKAADIGADSVGKLEMEIPEDDRRNAAAIADSVGDNVGKVAGMGSDMFESFVGSIIASIILANGDQALMTLPLWIAGGGIIASALGFLASALGFFSIRSNAFATEGQNKRELIFYFYGGKLISSFFSIVFSAVIVSQILGGKDPAGWRIFACICLGTVAGLILGFFIVYVTCSSFSPTQSIMKAGVTGSATVIIQGLGIGMASCIFPVLTVVATILGCNALYYEDGPYGFSIAAVSMLSTLGFTLAVDACEPIADNASAIVRMEMLYPFVRETTVSLDTIGGMAGATRRGFELGSAVLTALSLLVAFKEKVGVSTVDLGDPVVLSGLLLGAAIPFLFASLTMLSTRKATVGIIADIRRQFSETPKLWEGRVEVDSDICLAISAQSSTEEMLLPGLYAILSPLVVGFLIGPKCLTALLGGLIASATMLSISMSNAGGAWDSAQTYVDVKGGELQVQKACIVGDAVGDPLKDTIGPALLVLIKLMPMISLTFAHSMSHRTDDWHEFYYGFIPGGVLLLGTVWAYFLFWNDDLDTYSAFDGPKTIEKVGGEKISKEVEVVLKDLLGTEKKMSDSSAETEIVNNSRKISAEKDKSVRFKLEKKEIDTPKAERDHDTADTLVRHQWNEFHNIEEAISDNVAYSDAVASSDPWLESLFNKEALSEEEKSQNCSLQYPLPEHPPEYPLEHSPAYPLEYPEEYPEDEGQEVSLSGKTLLTI